ncbi:MAG TPA: hypothetical protein VEQ09_12275 [Aquabacterium sp.]|nr:hypothetical protein [Aquabacterium sp.]
MKLLVDGLSTTSNLLPEASVLVYLPVPGLGSFSETIWQILIQLTLGQVTTLIVSGAAGVSEKLLDLSVRPFGSCPLSWSFGVLHEVRDGGGFRRTSRPCWCCWWASSLTSRASVCITSYNQGLWISGLIEGVAYLPK